MVTGRLTIANFKDNITQSLNNTLNFENCGVFEKYDFEKDISKLGSALGLCEQTNYVIEEIVPYLKENAEMRSFTTSEVDMYSYKPMALSSALYGVIDFWWIILAVNGYLNPRDFHSFTKLVIPAKNDIEKIVDKELFANANIGVIPS